jgi:mannose-6-phosphate isomerase-like protein (cupin superfamily)
VPDHDHLTSPNLEGIDRFASEPKKVDKPWGYELIWALTDRYAGKLLHVKAGESLSLQFHNVKDEAWYVLEARAR